MTRTVITTDNAPALVAPLSQGARKGPILQVSGQLPLAPDTGEIVGTTVAEQTTQALRNVSAVLKAADADLEDVVMLRVYLTDPAHLGPMPLRYGSAGWGLVMRMACVPVRVGCGPRRCSARLSW
ncbi:Rid family hydrolase [Streptomyces rhizosphaericus]|uniref:Rid family hydrolase n=1 Tax=Streptomyces rhizosphaericus TaxID=114699 RepID=A0ABP4D9Z9_9ACTN|nr:Rid family hydrolase [Streptomyces indonesiensis]